MLPPAGAQALQNLDACAHTFNASFHAHTHKFNDMQKSCFQTIQTEWNCTREHSWHVLPSMVCAARLKLNSTHRPPQKMKDKQKNNKSFWWNKQKHHTTPHIVCVRVWRNCYRLPLTESIYITVQSTLDHNAHTQEEIKSQHHWWHNQAAEWNYSPCGRGAFQQDGIIQQDHTVGQCTRRRAPVVS